jgi:hypothetical protein
MKLFNLLIFTLMAISNCNPIQNSTSDIFDAYGDGLYEWSEENGVQVLQSFTPMAEVLNITIPKREIVKEREDFQTCVNDLLGIGGILKRDGYTCLGGGQLLVPNDIRIAMTCLQTKVGNGYNLGFHQNLNVSPSFYIL